MSAAKPASQGGSVSDFGVWGSVLARPVSCVQALRSDIDDPLPQRFADRAQVARPGEIDMMQNRHVHPAQWDGRRSAIAFP